MSGTLPSMIDNRTVVFVHGMYMNGSSWTPWTQRATLRGYSCHTPSWPFHDGQPADLRTTIDPALGRLTFGAVTNYLKAYIDKLPHRPILIGHSIGGLLVQKLVNDGYAAAGVAISPAPPRGVLSFDPHFLRANFPHVNPLAGNRPIAMTPRRFHYAFANTLSRSDSDAEFERYAVPESRNVPRTTLTSQGAIDFRRAHVPLLFLGGDRDHLTPLAMVMRNARAYPPKAGEIDCQTFRDRSHFICNEEGWEEVADTAFNWVTKL
jgi:pimeloyl-ACP methyl ester carboxylesterase